MTQTLILVAWGVCGGLAALGLHAAEHHYWVLARLAVFADHALFFYVLYTVFGRD